MESIYNICAVQTAAPSPDCIYFSRLQWSGLVDIIEFYASELAQHNAPVLHHHAVRRYLDAGYDMWFMLPGSFQFEQTMLRGFFKLAGMVLNESASLERFAGWINNYDLEKTVVDDSGDDRPIKAYTADQFSADLQRFREFSCQHSSFCFS